jgi:hypothetical protein
MKRGAILLIVVAALIMAGGPAQAVTKQCPSGTTQANPCKGTAKTRTSPGNDILVGTSGPEHIAALSGNDWINGMGGGDVTDGGARGGWRFSISARRAGFPRGSSAPRPDMPPLFGFWTALRNGAALPFVAPPTSCQSGRTDRPKRYLESWPLTAPLGKSPLCTLT